MAKPSFYERYFLPRLLNLAMKAPALNQVRRQLVPMATGRVLEIGIGSGLNLPYYDKSVHVTGVDPSVELQRYARDVADEAGIEVDFLTTGGEEIPADDNSFDSVVMTWTLCTIAEPGRALAEIRRVLKPGGQVVFAEHGEAPDAGIARWQARLNPMWNAMAGGCNLNRQIVPLYEDNGYAFADITQGYLPGPKIATYTFRGLAKLA